MTRSIPICVPQSALLCVKHLMLVQKTSRTSVEPPELESGAKPQLECRCGTGYKKDPYEGHRSRIPWGDSSLQPGSQRVQLVCPPQAGGHRPLALHHLQG